MMIDVIFLKVKHTKNSQVFAQKDLIISMKKFYVTTAIDYVNASPHIGHAYEKIAADIVARYHRSTGKEVFFLTGVDEHGSKVEKSAQEAGKNPKEFCDEMSSKFKEAWAELNLSFDHFIRTTDGHHEKAVQAIFKKLLDQGDIYKGTYEGLYCEGCEDFVRERDLDEEGNCPNHKKPPKKLEEHNYFFKLTNYKDKIQDWIANNPECIRPEGRKKEILNQLNDPELGDFSVTRARKSLTWGVPVPGDDEQVIYVWIDALSNYITGIGYNEDEKQFKKFWPADVHLIGKDINKFHSIYWPSMLIALGIEPPKQVFAHGFITVNGQKLSKSLGNVIDPNALVAEYGADAVRFYLLAATPFDNDGDFSTDDFIKQVNAQLANNLGNLLNRTLTLVVKNCDGQTPDQSPDKTLFDQAISVEKEVSEHMEKLEFAKSIDAIFGLVDQTNKYMNDQKPWSLFKEDKQKEGEVVLLTCMEILRRTALSIYPFTPKLAKDIWYQLGFDQEIETVHGQGQGPLKPGTKVRNTGPVFKRIEEVEKSKV